MVTSTRQAHARAVKQWGKTAHVEDRGIPTSPEIRADGQKHADEIRARSKEERHDLRKQLSAYRAQAVRYRYKVGEVHSIGGFGMFLVHGQGDSWDEAFDAAKSVKRASK